MSDLRPGHRVDALDTASQWLVAEVLRREGQRVFLHYVGWGERWDEWIEMGSERMLPVGTRSRQWGS